MAETIYTIPINEAFDKAEESERPICPFCELYDMLVSSGRYTPPKTFREYTNVQFYYSPKPNFSKIPTKELKAVRAYFLWKGFSRKYFSSEYGKEESWIILATRPGAKIFYGFKDGVTLEEFSAAIDASETGSDAMENLLCTIDVKAGDVIYIPAKMVHAIGSGCLLLEVQEPTDFTIQPERWCGDYKLSDEEMYLGLSRESARKARPGLWSGLATRRF